MRQFYLTYPIGATLSHQLSWSHYVELLKIENDLERSFYEKQAIIENWNIRELKRQKNASLYLRLAASKDKEGILKLAKQGHVTQKPEDLIREPYISRQVKPLPISPLKISYAKIELFMKKNGYLREKIKA
jgi:hypothetical protein